MTNNGQRKKMWEQTDLVNDFLSIVHGDILVAVTLTLNPDRLTFGHLDRYIGSIPSREANKSASAAS